MQAVIVVVSRQALSFLPWIPSVLGADACAGGSAAGGGQYPVRPDLFQQVQRISAVRGCWFLPLLQAGDPMKLFHSKIARHLWKYFSFSSSNPN